MLLADVVLRTLFVLAFVGGIGAGVVLDRLRRGAAERREKLASDPLALGRRKRAIFRAVGLGLATLFALVLGEVFCALSYARLVPAEYENVYRELLEGNLGPGGGIAFQPHPYTCYDLVPSFEDALMKWHTADGFRFPEMPRARRAGVYRIACMGGSTTYEPYVGVQNTFCAYLEEYLDRCFPDHEVEVLNAGVPAYNSCDTFARFHYRVLDYSPDMIVNYDGINDVWPMLCDEGPFENDLRNARKVMAAVPPPPGALASFLARHSRLFRVLYFKLALHGQVPHIMQLTYKHMDLTKDNVKVYEKASTSAFRRNLEDTYFICQGRGMQLVLSTFAADDFQVGRDQEKNPYAIQMRGVDDLNKVVLDIARAHSVPLVEMDRLMPRNPKDVPPELRYFGDTCHTTGRGNRAKANIFGARIAQLLETRFGTKRQPFELDTAPTPGGSYPPANLKRPYPAPKMH